MLAPTQRHDPDERSRRALLKALRAELIQGQRGPAAGAFRAALDGATLDVASLARVADFAARLSDLDLATDCLRRLRELEPNSLEWPCQLGHVARQRLDFDEAKAWLAKAAAIESGHPLVEHLRTRLAAARSDLADPDVLIQTLASPAAPILVAAKAAYRLISKGLTGPAREGLQGLAARAVTPEESRQIRLLLMAIDAIDACRSAGGDVRPVEWAGPAVMRRQEGTDCAAIVFTGIDGGFGGVPTDVVQALLVQQGVSAIYLFDPNRLIHLAGNAELGRDYMETLRSLRRTLDEWGVRRLTTIGASAGGYAAMRYGLDLGAQRVLCFGSPTTMERDVLLAEGRGRTIMDRLETYASDMIGPLRPRLEAADARPQIDLYFGAGMALDRSQAEAIADLDEVRLFAIPDLDRHTVVDELLLGGELPGIFEGAFAAAGRRA